MTLDNYFSSKEFLDNVRIYEEARKAGHSVYLEPDVLTDIAEYYHQKGKQEDAQQALDTAVEMFPGAIAPLVFRARMELLKNDNPKGARLYAEKIEDKTDLDYFYIHAEILLYEDKTEEAEAYLRRALEKVDEENREDFVIDTATLYADYDMMDKAQAWLSLSEEQDTPDYRELKGRIALGKGDYETGEEIFKKLLDENPYVGFYWNQLASSQLMRNHIQEAIESSEYSIAINPDDKEALLNKANGMFGLGNYEEALNYYQRFNALHQDDETGEIFLGVTLIHMDRLEEAVEHLQKAEAKAKSDSPNLPEIYQEAAFALSRLGRYEEALAYTDKALLTGEMNEEELLVLKGHIFLENGMPDEAQQYFSQAVKQSNDSPHILFRIGVSIYDNGYIRLAYKMFRMLLNIPNSSFTEGYSHLAMCCKLLHKNDEFKAALTKACKINPTEAKQVLGDLFPEELSPEHYIDYLKDNEVF